MSNCITVVQGLIPVKSLLSSLLYSTLLYSTLLYSYQQCQHIHMITIAICTVLVITSILPCLYLQQPATSQSSNPTQDTYTLAIITTYILTHPSTQLISIAIVHSCTLHSVTCLLSVTLSSVFVLFIQLSALRFDYSTFFHSLSQSIPHTSHASFLLSSLSRSLLSYSHAS